MLSPVQWNERLTVAGVQRLASETTAPLSLLLMAGWANPAALDALSATLGPRLQALRIEKGGLDFWLWLAGAGNTALQDLTLPARMLPESWLAAFSVPTGLLMVNVPRTRTALDLSPFLSVQQYTLIGGSHLKLRLNGKATKLVLNKTAAEPDGGWESLRQLTIIETRTALAPLLDATPAVDDLKLYWPFQHQDLAPLLQKRRWKRLTFNGSSRMPTSLIRQLWEARIADEFKAVRHVGPFQEESFENGSWEGYCTR